MHPQNSHYACAVVGNWHLSFITSACLAHLGNRTLMVNPLLSGDAPWQEFPALSLIEPGLIEMLARTRSENKIDFTNGVSSAWSADAVWLAVDTPVNGRDEPDTSPLVELAKQVAQSGSCRKVFVVTSQVPAGFCQRIERETGLKVAYVPENLRLGDGIRTFLNADRMVIGAQEESTRLTVKAQLNGMKSEFVLCDLPSSEMIKHATNAFLATSISFANEIARIGERMGVDNQLVAKALKLDKRIGPQAYVSPGLGFAGGTLPRDLRALQALGKQHDVPTGIVNAVLDVNERTNQAMLQALRDYLGTIEGKSILILGYTYKAGTDTLRRSTSVDLAKILKAAGGRLLGFDPPMNDRDLSPLQGILTHLDTIDLLREVPDAVVVMTPRPEFQTLDWKWLSSNGTKPKRDPLVLDARSFLPAEPIIEAGFAYKALWQPVQS